MSAFTSTIEGCLPQESMSTIQQEEVSSKKENAAHPFQPTFECNTSKITLGSKKIYHCIACGISSKDSTVPFLQFPKDHARAKKWIQQLKIEIDISKFTLNSFHEKFRICANHFERCFMSSLRKTLIKGSLPDVIDYNSSLELSSNNQMLICTADNVKHCDSTSFSISSSSVTNSSCPFIVESSSAPNTAATLIYTENCNESNFLFKSSTPVLILQKASNVVDTSSPTFIKSVQMNSIDLINESTKEKNMLKVQMNANDLINESTKEKENTLKVQRNTVAFLKKEITALKQQVDLADENVNIQLLKTERKRMKHILPHSVHKLFPPEYGALKTQWSSKDIADTLAISLQNPTLYKTLCHSQRMPSKKIITKFMSEIAVKPTFLPLETNILQQNQSEIFKKNRLCLLSFNEVTLKKELRCTSLCTERVDDDSQSSLKNVIAKQVLIFTVHSLTMQWKQSFGYFFTDTGMQLPILKSLIFESLEKIAAVGLTVVAVVCNQSTVNDQLYEDLGCSESKPFMLFHNHKIFVFYDPPHLMKLVGSDVMEYKLTYSGKKSFSWDHILNFYSVDSQLKYRIAPKLTERHVNRHTFEAMVPSNAVHMFNHSIAAGICFLAASGHIPEGALSSADFIAEMDELYELFNKHSLLHNKELIGITTTKDFKLGNFQKKYEWVKSWQFDISEGEPFLTLSKKGWLLTLNARIQLFHELQNECSNLFFINDEVGEVYRGTFCDICKDGHKENPECLQFQSAVRTVMLYNIFSSEKLAHYRNNFEELLQSMCSQVSNDAQTNSEVNDYLYSDSEVL